MQVQTELNRYVALTEAGRRQLESVRRKYHKTVEEVAADDNTPSINTVKRTLRKGPVFVSTLDRIWDYFQACAAENAERLPYPVEGEDYIYVDGAPGADKPIAEERASAGIGSNAGWISRGVPRPNRLFTGRVDVLADLHTALKTGPAALVGDPQALTGLGGIGKTQTAVAYIYEHRRDYSHVFWVSSESVDDLNDGLAGLAEELGLTIASPTMKRAALERMHEWFRSQSNWLLVVDNADDLETLAPHFPRHHTGCLILTTRARNTVKWAAPITLQKFGPKESALLILRRAGLIRIDQSLSEAPPDLLDAAAELNEELDGLPLALDQAGAYLAQTGARIPDYLSRYRQRGLEILESAADEEHASVAITFRLAIEQMARRNRCGDGAVEMVRLAAFLSPDAIPEVIFKSYAFDNLVFHDTDLYNEICTAVCAYSLAARNGQNETVTVHRLVQKVTRDSLDEGEQRLWAARTVRAVSDATPDFEFEDWGLCDLLLPQWRLCRKYIRDGEIETAQAGYLLYQAARYLRARALYEVSEDYIRAAIAIVERLGDGRGVTMSDYLDELACLCRVLDRREEAEALHHRALEMMEAAVGSESSLTASKLHNLALLYFQAEEYSRAEPVFLRALAIYEKQPEPEMQFIATTLTQLAGVYRCKGEFEKAEPFCRRALHIYEGMLAPNHIDIATASNNLGLLYLTMGKHADAEEQYERALAINEEVRGDSHPETGTVLWGLGRVHWQTGRRGEADELFRRAIRIYSDNFGKEHSRTLRMIQNYAEFRDLPKPRLATDLVG